MTAPRADVYHACAAVFAEAGAYPSNGEFPLTRDDLRRIVLTRGVTTNIRKADELWRILILTGAIRPNPSDETHGIFRCAAAKKLLTSQNSTVQLMEGVWE